MTRPNPVRTPDGYARIDNSGGGTLDGVQNVGGAPGEVFRDITGTTINLRTLLGVNGATVTTVGDTIEIDGGGGASPVLSDSFLDNTTLDIPVGLLASDGQIVVDMSCTNTVTGEVEGLQWVFGVSSTAAAADIVQTPANGTLLDIGFSGLAVGPNVVARLAGTGGGDLIEIRYTVKNIPRL